MREEIVVGSENNEQIESINSAENLVVDPTPDSDIVYEAEQLASSDGNTTYWCKVCGNEAEDGTLECEGCCHWIHAKCVNINQKELLMIDKLDKKLKWFCSGCEKRIGEMFRQKERLPDRRSSSGENNNHLENETESRSEDQDEESGVALDGVMDKINSVRIRGRQEIMKFANELQVELNKIDERFDNLDRENEELKDEIAWVRGETQDLMYDIRGNSSRNTRTKEETRMNNTQDSNNCSSKARDHHEVEDDAHVSMEVIQSQERNIMNNDNREDSSTIQKERNEVEKYRSRQKYLEEYQKNIHDNISDREREERDHKKNNLVLYNIPESRMKDIDQRIKYDMEICGKIIYEEIGEKEFCIEKINRLGKIREDGKPRPTLIRLRCETEKWRILGKAKNLRKSNNFARIYVAKDMTIKEKELDRELREELAERRNNGEFCQIKNGMIVKKRKERVFKDFLNPQEREYQNRDPNQVMMSGRYQGREKRY